MNMHRQHCSTTDITYLASDDPSDYPSFSRNVTIRASTGTLKQPRLPGSEKFRFSQNLEIHRDGLNTLPARKSRRVTSCSSTLLSSSTSSKRKPILPISRNTSRVLNNTNVELSADTIELITQETNNLTKICKNYIEVNGDHAVECNSDKWSRSSSDQSLEHEHSHSHIIVPPRKEKFFPRNNTDIYLPTPNRREMNNNQAKFDSIQSNNLRLRSHHRHCSTSPSPSQSIISSDDDVWVLRTDDSR